MAVWFEGSGHIDCGLQRVEHALEDPGKFFAAIVGTMPGLTNVELAGQRADAVTITTNEGRMERSNISVASDATGVTVDFDEKYQAGSKVTATSHFSHQFTGNATSVTHRLVISDVEAPGLLGFFYKRFGSSRTGNAFLKAHKAYFEKSHDGDADPGSPAP